MISSFVLVLHVYIITFPFPLAGLKATGGCPTNGVSRCLDFKNVVGYWEAVKNKLVRDERYDVEQ